MDCFSLPCKLYQNLTSSFQVIGNFFSNLLLAFTTNISTNLHQFLLSGFSDAAKTIYTASQKITWYQIYAITSSTVTDFENSFTLETAISYLQNNYTTFLPPLEDLAVLTCVT